MGNLAPCTASKASLHWRDTCKQIYQEVEGRLSFLSFAARRAFAPIAVAAYGLGELRQGNSHECPQIR